MLLRTDNCTATTYINRVGGFRYATLLKLAENLLVWALDHLLSLRVLYVMGLENRAANLMSRVVPCQTS